MRYSHVVFDLDGTLLDTETAVLCSLQDTVFHFTQKHLTLEELYFALGITSEDALIRLGIPDVSASASYWNDAMNHYTNSISLFAGVPALLNSLRSAGCVLGIVTSKTVAEFAKDFAPFGIVPYFSTVICADDTQQHKPNAEPLLKYLEQSSADRSKTLYIGDSRFDYACASSAGVDFALALWGTHEPELPAEYHLSHPDDLLGLVL